MQEALTGYLQPDIVRAIRDARSRLGQYLSDAEAEKIAAQIPYWDYRTAPARVRRKTQR